MFQFCRGLVSTGTQALRCLGLLGCQCVVMVFRDGLHFRCQVHVGWWCVTGTHAQRCLGWLGCHCVALGMSVRYRILVHAHFPLFVSSATLYHVFVLKITEKCFQVGCGSGKPPFTLSLHDATRRIFGMLQLLIPGTMDFGGYVFVPDRIESFSLRFSSEKTHDNAITVLRFLLNYVVFEMLMFVAYLRFKHIASHCYFCIYLRCTRMNPTCPPAQPCPLLELFWTLLDASFLSFSYFPTKKIAFVPVLARIVLGTIIGFDLFRSLVRAVHRPSFSIRVAAFRTDFRFFLLSVFLFMLLFTFLFRFDLNFRL